MTRFPWARPRRERLALVLVALVALTPAQFQSTQDDSRLAVAQQLLDHGTVRIDPLSDTNDVSRYGGHWYTNKAPLMSFYAIPAVAVGQAADDLLGIHHRRVNEGRWHRWLFRVVLNGPLLLGFAFLLGRVCEGLQPGTGAAAAVVAGAGTLLPTLSSVLFSHVGAALLAFGAFCLAWRRSRFLSGLVAGAAVVWEYQAALASIVVAAYVALAGLRALGRFVAGAIPAAILLAVYDAVAFGSPVHLSYRYSTQQAEEWRSSFFGLSVPSLSQLRAVLLGESGLQLGHGILVTTPILFAAGAGLVLLYLRGFRAEALVCMLVSLLLVVMNAGYFDPYGGKSPGPRFMVPAAGFALLGLAEAFARLRRPTIVLAVTSIVVTALNLGWSFPRHVSLRTMPQTVYELAGLPHDAGLALVFVAAAAAAAFVVLEGLRAARPAIA